MRKGYSVPRDFSWIENYKLIYTKERREDDDTPHSAHSNEDYSYSITKCNGSAFDEVSVDKKHIYLVKKTCCQNQENPWLSFCITQILSLLLKMFESYYLVARKVIPHEKIKQFSLP